MGEIDRLVKDYDDSIAITLELPQPCSKPSKWFFFPLLQTAPEMFPVEEFNINENKVNTDVHFPGAAFLIVSCKTDPKATKKEWVKEHLRIWSFLVHPFYSRVTQVVWFSQGICLLNNHHMK